MLERYVAQVRLHLNTLQDVANETVFALEGGTVINLFYKDMPRLSVDIDLTYQGCTLGESGTCGMEFTLRWTHT